MMTSTVPALAVLALIVPPVVDVEILPGSADSVIIIIPPPPPD
jgi:hypothetical protein